MKTQTEKLNVRDFVTIAILTVVELAVYFVIGMPPWQYAIELDILSWHSGPPSRNCLYAHVHQGK